MDAYIVKAYRTAVGKADKGGFRHTRADDLAVSVIKHIMAQVPDLDPEQVDDVIVGNAVPEAEQGLQMGRWIALMALGKEVPGVIVNRYCASGLETMAMATAKIQSGMASCIIAGGAESMSQVPTRGWKTSPNYKTSTDHADYFIGMGLTGEEVASKYKITREDQDQFAYKSHINAINAIENGLFKNEIVPVEVEEVWEENDERVSKKFIVDTDEGPRKDTSLEVLGKLKPVFRQGGTVTAGNSSQRSDGAAFTLIMSEKMVKELGVEPIARIKACASAGVDPRIMGIGPVEAVPKVLKQAGMKLSEIQMVELNEAFAAQSVAVIRELDLDPDIVNVNGGAIALGHPLGCTGCKLSVQMIHELKRRKQKYGVVTACVGGGQGIAGIIEVL
ncbi:thiolase family protein [Fulvivirga maritima]|uniref:thiolase family protein n=1 Tax=Fulvivirga maritima TaxID=2904247 RepID=UPI001F351B77|nr:thiolase family protein [Fulvivirga maritima]UII25008.1 thiolase family protein [Fulvivirga maritima]